MTGRAPVAVLLCGLLGCTSVYDNARQDVAALAAFASGEVGTLERYDHDHQVAIAREGVALGAPDRARAKLAEWETEYQQLRSVLHDAQALLAAAPAIITLIESGTRPKTDLAKLLADAVGAVDKLREAFKQIGSGGGP